MWLLIAPATSMPVPADARASVLPILPIRKKRRRSFFAYGEERFHKLPCKNLIPRWWGPWWYVGPSPIYQILSSTNHQTADESIPRLSSLEKKKRKSIPRWSSLEKKETEERKYIRNVLENKRTENKRWTQRSFHSSKIKMSKSSTSFSYYKM